MVFLLALFGMACCVLLCTDKKTVRVDILYLPDCFTPFIRLKVSLKAIKAYHTNYETREFYWITENLYAFNTDYLSVEVPYSPIYNATLNLTFYLL